MSDLRNMWTEGIRELENSRMYCTNNDENNNEMDGMEVIDLCSVSQSKTDTLLEGKESGKQESQDKSKKRWHEQNGSRNKDNEEPTHD